MQKVSQREFAEYFENLNNEDAVFLWGANGEPITKDLVDRLFEAYGSATYNKEYYTTKLIEGQGRIGADASGAAYPLSGEELTPAGYYKSCIKKGVIGAIPKDLVCLVFDKKKSHMGFYLGNGYTVEMKNSRDNVNKEKIKPSRWAYYGLPSFVDYSVSLDGTPVNVSEEVNASNTIIKDYQLWLNSTWGTSVTPDGRYGTNTRTATIKALQQIFVKYFGARIEVTGEYDLATKKACPLWDAIKKNKDAIAAITYIVHVFLYNEGYCMNQIVNGTEVKKTFSSYSMEYVMDYQSRTRGLRVDGKPASATLYAMFH